MVACFFLVAGLLPVAFATSVTTTTTTTTTATGVTTLYTIPTWWLARWGPPGLGQFHRSLGEGTYGFMWNWAGDSGASERDYSGISLSATNGNGNQVFAGFADYNIATVGSIQSISITGTGTYVARLWFDASGSGQYGVWSSEGLRTGFGSDTFGEVFVAGSPHNIDIYTPIILRYVNGVPCTMVMSNCKVTLNQMQHGKVPGITSGVEIALAISVNNNVMGTTQTAQINQIAVTTS